jgi:glycosyl transferase family 25
MNIYIVSMPDAVERRQHTNDQFGRFGLSFTYFDALNGMQALALAAKMNIDVDTQKLGQGEIGCFMSHVALWQQVAEGDNPYGAIFEDDVFLGENTNLFLNESQWLPENTDVLKLETMQIPCRLDQSGLDAGCGRMAQVLLSDHWGTAGYILSKQGAAALLRYVASITVNIPVDHLMFEHFRRQADNTVYQLNPALCIQQKVLAGDIQNLADSTLEQERRLRNRGNEPVVGKKNIRQKAMRELKRLYRQLSVRYWYAIYTKARDEKKQGLQIILFK